MHMGVPWALFVVLLLKTFLQSFLNIPWRLAAAQIEVSSNLLLLSWTDGQQIQINALPQQNDDFTVGILNTVTKLSSISKKIWWFYFLFVFSFFFSEIAGWRTTALELQTKLANQYRYPSIPSWITRYGHLPSTTICPGREKVLEQKSLGYFWTKLHYTLLPVFFLQDGRENNSTKGPVRPNDESFDRSILYYNWWKALEESV